MTKKQLEAASVEEETPRQTRWLYLGLAVAFFVVYTLNLYSQAGPQATGIVCGSMVGGFVCWILTTWRRPANPKLIVPVYLVTMALFFIHVLEEYLFHFSDRIAELFGLVWPESEFVMTIMLLGPMIWLGAAVGLIYRNPFANFIAWFLLFGMVLGEPAHLVFPIVEGGAYHYFPGMWTALLPMVTAIFGIVLIVRDHRAWVAATRTSEEAAA